MRENIKKTQPINDPLNLRTKPLNFFVSLLPALIASLALTATLGLLGAKLVLSDSFLLNYFTFPDFLSFHSSEHLTVLVYDRIHVYLSGHFTMIFLLALAAFAAMMTVLFFSTGRNDYIFVKFSSAVCLASGLVLILLPLLLLIVGAARSAVLLTQQNTALFQAYMRSSFFTLIVFGVALLAVSYTLEFTAAYISRKRYYDLQRSMK